MKCIEELKKIGIQEINFRTKIATKRLDDIFECKFDEIDRTRVKGFIYILQREYKIDMSEWLEKYDEYHKEKEEESQQNEDEKDVKSDKSDNVNIAFVDTTIKDKTYTRLVGVFLILFVLFIGYFVYNNLIKDENSNISDVKNIDKQDLSANKTNIASNLDSVSNLNTVDSNATIESIQDSNENSNLTTSNEVVENNMHNNDESIDNKGASQADSTHSVADDNTLIPTNNNVNSIFSTDEAIIIPKSPLWVGVIDLQTYKKKQISVSDSFSISLDGAKIIRTGHGYFDIKSQNLNEKYIGGDSKYFIYTREDGLKEISKEEFLGFNRGKEW